MGKIIMSVFAHPDDETFGVAGTLYRLTQQGHQVFVVTATRGEEGEIADPALATQATLGEVRERELRAAMATVGVEQVAFLDYRDGHLAEANFDEAVGRIVTHIRAVRPNIIITFAPNGVYGHPDHMRIHELAISAVTAAADPAQYPQSGSAHRVSKVYYSSPSREALLTIREIMRARGEDFVPGGNAATIPVEAMGIPEAELTTTIHLSDDEFAAKMRAMRAHASQMPAGTPFLEEDSPFQTMRLSDESFILAPPPLSDTAYPTPEDDLVAGL